LHQAAELLAALLSLTGLYPLAKTLRANRTTTLGPSLWWAVAAWLAWIGVAWVRLLWPGEKGDLITYGALCLTSCAGVSVLGARRPGAAAWNFVVAGLLAVLLLPILNGMGELRLEPAQGAFLALTLLVAVLNYLPTRLGVSAVITAVGCCWEMIRLWGWIRPADLPGLGPLLLALTPWIAWLAWAKKRTAGEFDRLWLAYRDRFGFVWGQRMREQFNRAAHHAGWPMVLRWSGLHPTAAEPMPDPTALVAMLRAVLKRFQTEETT